MVLWLKSFFTGNVAKKWCLPWKTAGYASRLRRWRIVFRFTAQSQS